MGPLTLVEPSLKSWAALAASIIVFVFLQSHRRWSNRIRGRRLPPGPKGLPIIGNVLDFIRLENQWAVFKDWCTQYGDLVYLRVAGQHIVIIGSSRLATELLEKRSSNTSDRPVSPVLPLVGNDAAFSTMRYGQTWREHRRAFWQVFHPRAIQEYRDVQQVYLRRFLHKLLTSPEDLEEHVRYMFAATMMKILYDIDTQDNNNELIAKVHEAMSCSMDIVTGRHPIDFCPWLQYLPSWIPGAGFQHALAKCKAAVTYVKEVPYALTKAASDQGSASSCTISVLLSRAEDDPDMAAKANYEEIVKNVGLVAFEGGSDTSFSTLMSLFLAMLLYPEVQRKAQAELNAVIGTARLPDFNDRESLPYVNAVIKELLRWHVILPLGLPHRTVEDDEVDGYFIPAGTIILPNTWAMMQDPEEYEQPDVFNPDRFIRDGQLDPSVRDPFSHVFGFGRRVCAGRAFADEMLFLTVSSVLHLFDIVPGLSAEGRPIKPEHHYEGSLLCYPKDVRCTVKLRHKTFATTSLLTDA